MSNPQNAGREWPMGFKFLHVSFALLITMQLFSELYMKKIWKKRGQDHFQHLLFHAHMWAGMATVVVLGIFWYWVYKNGDVRSHFFPYSGAPLQGLCDDIAGLTKKKLPPHGVRGGLPGLVHGLGMLVVTSMAVTGFFMFFLIPPFGVAKPEHIYQIPKKIHDFLSTLVWIYWWGHISMALLHARTNRGILRIFNPMAKA